MKSKIAVRDLALKQLRIAIQIFNKGNYVPAITLAGAANEIFGKFAKANANYGSTDLDKWFWDGIAEAKRKQKISRDKVYSHINNVKNTLKHYDYKNTFIEADFEFEALSHIDSAIKNYQIAFGALPNDRVITNYIKLHHL